MRASDVEAASREKIAAVQVEQLKQQVRYVLANSPFYARRLAAAGVEGGDIRSLDDLARLPMTAKSDLRISQRDTPPFGDYLCVDPSEISWVPTTSGTTGNPTLLPRTSSDIELWTGHAARALECVGLTSGDVYQNMAPYEHAFTGMILHLGAQSVGATVLNTGLGNTDRQLWIMEHLATTVAHATPSYWIHLGQRAAELGLTDRLALRVGFGGGEPGMKVEAFQQRLRSLFPRTRFRDAYGITDVGTPVFIECHEGAGGHGLEQALILEVVGSDGRQVASGEVGELVVTDLAARTAPLLRFRTGDLTVYDDTPCSCGRTTRRFPEGVTGRIDDMVTIKSVNVYPSAIEELLHSVPGVGAEWKLIIERGDSGLDEPTLQLEVSDPSEQRTRQRVVELLRAQLRFSVRVELLPPGSLPATTFKARRVVDRRAESTET